MRVKENSCCQRGGKPNIGMTRGKRKGSKYYDGWKGREKKKGREKGRREAKVREGKEEEKGRRGRGRKGKGRRGRERRGIEEEEEKRERCCCCCFEPEGIITAKSAKTIMSVC